MYPEDVLLAEGVEVACSPFSDDDEEEETKEELRLPLVDALEEEEEVDLTDDFLDDLTFEEEEEEEEEELFRCELRLPFFPGVEMCPSLLGDSFPFLFVFKRLFFFVLSLVSSSLFKVFLFLLMEIEVFFFFFSLSP